MGLEKLNPFKKSTKSGETVDHLAPNRDLQPTKSTSSIANSIRSFGEKAEEFMSKGERPHEPFSKDGSVEVSRQFPIVGTAGPGGAGANTLAPSPSAGLM